LVQVTRKRLDDAAAKAASPAAAPIPKAQDEVMLSEIAKRVDAEPGFDAAKVAAIKKAVVEGGYPLDAKRIAESFASLEKLIGNRG
jgi:negative regulator of flagellin synthesis FlgM